MAPSVTARLKTAKSLLDAGDPTTALSNLDALLAVAPTNYHAHVLRGLALRTLSDIPSSLHAYRAAIALRPHLPLAHKGVIDAISPADPLPGHQSALADAHLALDTPHHHRLAHQLLFRLALAHPDYLDRAVDHLLPADPHPSSHSPSAPTAHPTWQAAHLLAVHAPDDNRLAPALQLVHRLSERSALPIARDPARAACEQRAVRHCLEGTDVPASLRFLTACGAYEALLRLAETGLVSAADARRAALRALHAYPWEREGRARFVVAAELERTGGAVDAVVRNLAGLAAVKAGALPRPPGSCTEALVVAVLRMGRGEYKLAAAAARAGRKLAGEGEGLERVGVLFGLVLAGNLAREQAWEEALREFQGVAEYVRRVEDVWMETAATQGVVQTCVAAFGRKSRRTCLAIEEAAGTRQNCFALLESTWTDALVAGDVDVETMTDLVHRAVVEANSEKSEHQDEKSGWHSYVLAPIFTIPRAKLAAIAMSRLGQMVMAQQNPGVAHLKRAQAYQMEAANLYKGLANPFAHLGWIFEKRHEQLKDKISVSRAMRCYEKAVGINPAHPLVARSLARLLQETGNERDAVAVAHEAVSRNPKERWAHNLIGWSRINSESYNEASISFRNGLKGKPQMSNSAKEVLYGTSVGQTVGDNDLIIDVDSWRGLSVAYKRQGKFGPAIACLEDALALVRKPPYYVTIVVGDYKELCESLVLLLESERSVLMQRDGRSQEAKDGMESVLQDSRAPLTIKKYLSEALVYMAAQDWVSGCYIRATDRRMHAAEVLEQALLEHQQKLPFLNPFGILKQLGDTLLEVATPYPDLLQQVATVDQANIALAKAEVAYAKALHYAPWDHNQAGQQDVLVAVLRAAALHKDVSHASGVVDLLSRIQLDPSVLTLLLLDAAAIQVSEKFQREAIQIARKVTKSVVSTAHLANLDASIAIASARLGDIAVGAQSSVSAVSRDPSNWRAWIAVGMVREADARSNGWPVDMMRSCEDAYQEADRLGAGPFAAHGIVRCLTKRLEKIQDIEINPGKAYAEACFCISTAARVGLSEPSACRGVIDEFLAVKEREARAKAQELAQAKTATEAHRHVHLYPFLPVPPTTV